MSDVLETIKSRRSIRKYKSDMIPQDKLEKIIEAGTYAATGMGKQSPIRTTLFTTRTTTITML